VHIIVHNGHTQHSTEQFWLSSLLSPRQASELRCCLLEERDWVTAVTKLKNYEQKVSTYIDFFQILVLQVKQWLNEVLTHAVLQRILNFGQLSVTFSTLCERLTWTVTELENVGSRIDMQTINGS